MIHYNHNSRKETRSSARPNKYQSSIDRIVERGRSLRGVRISVGTLFHEGYAADIVRTGITQAICDNLV